MKKKYLKMISITLLLVMAFSVSALAASKSGTIVYDEDAGIGVSLIVTRSGKTGGAGMTTDLTMTYMKAVTTNTFSGGSNSYTETVRSTNLLDVTYTEDYTLTKTSSAFTASHSTYGTKTSTLSV